MSSAPHDVAALIHKTVAFQFDGRTLQFGLSQSLFSSHEVDTGSRLLLKSLAQQLAGQPEEQRRLRSILDLGCGTGVLGVALARRYGAALTARDRDALALAVTAHNATLNGVSCTTAGGVDVANLDGTRDSGGYDLVVANLPAKAGTPVLAHLLARAAAVTAAGGRIAVVVVSPLAAQTRRQLAAVADLTHETRSRGHAVLQARPRATGQPAGTPRAPLAAYRRHQGEFTLAGRTYPLVTVYGLSDFDTPSHLARVTAAVIQRASAALPVVRSMLVWNPGQGHLPVWLACTSGAPAGAGPRLTLVGRDALQLLATAANLRRVGIPAHALTVRHQVGLGGNGAAPDRHQLALLRPDDDLGGHSRRTLLSSAAALLDPEGAAVLAGSAPLIAPLLVHCKPLALVREARRRALRAAVLRPTGAA